MKASFIFIALCIAAVGCATGGDHGTGGDGGVVLRDSGFRPTDAGGVRDSGFRPTDAGGVRDSGTTFPRDSGVRRDGGFPLPRDGGGFPSLDAGGFFCASTAACASMPGTCCLMIPPGSGMGICVPGSEMFGICLPSS